MESATTKRRSHWQALAHRKYRRMKWTGGDGEYLSLSKCTEPWTYTLENDYVLARIAQGNPCGSTCRGTHLHSGWRLKD